MSHHSDHHLKICQPLIIEICIVNNLNQNSNSEVGISNNYSTKNNIIRANNSDNLNSSFQYKPTHSNKYISGRNLIMNTGTNVIEASNFNPIKVVDDMGNKSGIIQNKTPNQVRINKHEDKNSFSRLGFDKEIEKNADFNPHLEYNLRRAPRHSIVNISNGIDSSQRNRNGNQTVILSESYRSPGKVTLLHPEIDQKIVRNNKMDHITTYIFNEK